MSPNRRPPARNSSACVESEEKVHAGLSTQQGNSAAPNPGPAKDPALSRIRVISSAESSSPNKCRLSSSRWCPSRGLGVKAMSFQGRFLHPRRPQTTPQVGLTAILRHTARHGRRARWSDYRRICSEKFGAESLCLATSLTLARRRASSKGKAVSSSPRS